MGKKRYYGYGERKIPENIKVEKIEKEIFDCYIGKEKITHNENRYIIIDGDTGEIFDDAQGFGYKDYKSALKAFYYKKQSKEKIDEKYDKEIHINKWKKENKPFVRIIETELFYGFKENHILSFSEFETIFHRENKQLNGHFTLEELYKTFVK